MSPLSAQESRNTCSTGTGQICFAKNFHDISLGTTHCAFSSRRSKELSLMSRATNQSAPISTFLHSDQLLELDFERDLPFVKDDRSVFPKFIYGDGFLVIKLRTLDITSYIAGEVLLSTVRHQWPPHIFPNRSTS